jgi:hypothetical protein
MQSPSGFQNMCNNTGIQLVKGKESWYFYYYHKMVLRISILGTIFTSVFHRILDFKSGVEFLFRPLFYFIQF